MAATTLEQRVSQIERELARMKKDAEHRREPENVPWWEAIAGTFAGSEAHEEATRLGREYRDSLRPKARSEAKSATSGRDVATRGRLHIA